jgi:signal transduction histidine kinase/CheY-like chemotaxis protein
MATTSEGLVAFAPDGRVMLMNEAAEEILGMPRSAVMGSTVSALGMPELTSQVERALTTPLESTVRFSLTPGEQHLSCGVGAYEDEHGGGVALTLRDDTELIRQQEHSDAILASTGDGLVVFSPEREITYMNPAASELLGIEAEEVVGTRTSLAELLGMDSPDVEDAVRCWEQRQCGREECPLHGGDVLRCWLHSGTIGEDGRPVTYVTKQPRCEECNVFAHNTRALLECGHDSIREVGIDEPEYKVVRVTANSVVDEHGHYVGCVTSLTDVTAEREIAQMKNEFVSTVSHELRTPLTSIKGYVDLILDGDAGEINDIQREFLGIVKSNSDRLVALINDMLDISRIESGRVVLKIEPIDISDLVYDAVGTFKTIAEQSDIEMAAQIEEGLEPAAADRDRIGQVLTNLVSNAIKYSPGGGTVTVSARQDGDDIVVGVADEGLGISEEDQEQLFSKFYRVDSSHTQEIGGTGLGLSITKSIVELHGGRVWLESTLGEGSTFSFTVPTASSKLVRTPRVVAPEEVPGGRVLIVDRDPEIAKLIETYLAKRGYETLTAFSAKEALEIAERERPQAITLDVMLDDMDGFVLLRRLKEHPETANIPVVVLSVVCDEGRSCRLGAANYLEKPIDQDRLIGTIDGLVGTKEVPLVLVVDDDRDVACSISRTLSSKGFAAACAYDGREALAWLEDNRPDVILTDLRMPELDGYQLIERVKGDAATADLPIVVMSGYALDADKVDTLSLTAGQVSKPFSPEDVAERVSAMLEHGTVGTEEPL